MDNDKTMKRKSISLIAKNLILLLSVAITGVIGAWSWFSNSKTATANGISVSCEVPDGIEIAIVEHGASAPADDDYTVGELELTENSPIIQNLIANDEKTGFTEVTSDGVIFQKPLLQQNDGKATPITDVEWDPAYEGKDYMCFDLYIRSEAELEVYLDAGSSVESVAEKLIGVDVENKSIKGDFSKDCIVGATRVSVIDSDESQTKRLLWIPRPDVYLQENPDDNDKPFVVKEGVVKNITDVHTTWRANWSDDGKSVEYETQPCLAIVSDKVPKDDGKYMLKDKVLITTLDTQKDDGYYYSYVTCNLWIEGEDSESRLALAGGNFMLNIKLKGE